MIHVKHSVAEHLLTLLRDKNTSCDDYRQLAYRLTQVLAMEAMRDLPLADKPIETPIEKMVGKKLYKDVVVVAILRAGIGMVQPIIDLLPNVTVGYIGMERNEETAIASCYYCKLPNMQDKIVYVVDPMLATGGSAESTIEMVFEKGAADVRFISMVAAPEGVERLESRFPNVPIYTAGFDRELNEKKYIMPGLGDFGDRLYGTLD